VHLEGLGQSKNPLTSRGIELTTFWLVCNCEKYIGIIKHKKYWACNCDTKCKISTLQYLELSTAELYVSIQIHD
jgi:hypothetical protein